MNKRGVVRSTKRRALKSYGRDIFTGTTGQFPVRLEDSDGFPEKPSPANPEKYVEEKVGQSK